VNTILILMDSMRRDHLGCYSLSRPDTPNIDRFSNTATVFERSYIGSYPCMPARHDLWTGQLNFLRRGWSPLEYDQPDLVTLLSQSGVRTSLITDHYHYWQYGSGNYFQSFNSVDLVRGQEKDNFKTGNNDKVEFPAKAEKLNPDWHRYYMNIKDNKSEDDYFTARVFNSSMRWLEENHDQGDFFMMIDCFDPHEPFDPPLEYARKFLPEGWEELIKWPCYGNADRFSKHDLEIIHGLYCGEISFLDHCFGKFYRKLEQLNLLDDTTIILTADHGLLFGEHNWIGKHSRILFNDICTTPLIIYNKSLGSGRNSSLVQMSDIMPTILDIMGVEKPDGIQGKSLAPIWDQKLRNNEDILHRDAILFGVFGGAVYCTDGDYVFIKKPNETNSPLYWYTRSHFNNWDFGQINYWRDSIKRIEQFDGRRFPVQYKNAHPRHAAPEFSDEKSKYASGVDSCDELYDTANDYAQTHNLVSEKPEKTRYFKNIMKRLMVEFDAPAEQFERLGL